MNARISFVHQACGMDFIVQKRGGTPSKKDDSKTAESKELQRLLNLSQLLTESNFSKLTEMWQAQNNEDFKGTRISKSTIQQPPLFELLAVNMESAQEAFGEFLNLIKRSNYVLDKFTIEKFAFILANKYYLLLQVRLLQTYFVVSKATKQFAHRSATAAKCPAHHRMKRCVIFCCMCLLITGRCLFPTRD